MIDIHAHVLPGLDDGPANQKEAKELLSMLHNEGVEMVIATTHYNPESYPDVSIERCKRELKKLPSEIPVLLGFELHSLHLPPDVKKYTLAGSNYVLIEFTPFTPVTSIPFLIKNLREKDVIPIVAHVERYTLDIRNLRLIKKAGGLLQFNARNIVKMGAILYKLIKLGLIDFVASDIHPGRPPDMRQAYEKIGKFNEEFASLVFMENPYKVIKNLPVEGGVYGTN